MLQLPRIPELAQRDRFVRRAVAEARVLTLSDEENASVPSQKVAGRTVQLFWSSPVEARRWAEALAGNRDLQTIPLAMFVSDILPGIAKAKGLAGTDWVSDPIEAEIDPADLLIRLKSEALSPFLQSIRAQGEVCLLIGGKVPVPVPHPLKGEGHSALAIYASRQDAERHVKRGPGERIASVSMAEFDGSVLPWAGREGLAVVLEPIPGGGFLELRADDLKRRLETG